MVFSSDNVFCAYNINSAFSAPLVYLHMCLSLLPLIVHLLAYNSFCGLYESRWLLVALCASSVAPTTLFATSHRSVFSLWWLCLYIAPMAICVLCSLCLLLFFGIYVWYIYVWFLLLVLHGHTSLHIWMPLLLWYPVICFDMPPLVTPLAYGLAILMALLLSLHGSSLLPSCSWLKIATSSSKSSRYNILHLLYF